MGLWNNESIYYKKMLRLSKIVPPTPNYSYGIVSEKEHHIPEKITLLSEFKFIDTVEQILVAYLAEHICYFYV